MGPKTIVMIDKYRGRSHEVPCVQDQQPVQAFRPNRANEPLRDPIRLRDPTTHCEERSHVEWVHLEVRWPDRQPHYSNWPARERNIGGRNYKRNWARSPRLSLTSLGYVGLTGAGGQRRLSRAGSPVSRRPLPRLRPTTRRKWSRRLRVGKLAGRQPCAVLRRQGWGRFGRSV